MRTAAAAATRLYIAVFGMSEALQIKRAGENR
jgi:hypothetical protein